MHSNDYELTVTMTIKAVRNRLPKLPRRLRDSQTVIPVSQRGRPIMALMSWELFEAMVDTIELLSDSEVMSQIKESEKAISEGRTISFSEVLAELGIDLNQIPSESG